MAHARVALAQIAPVPGAIAHNEALIAESYRRARGAAPQCVVTPELALTGYPLRDLVLGRGFLPATEAALQRLAALTADGPPLIVGAPHRTGAAVGHGLVNAAVALESGRVAAVIAKRLLPNYDVFDEPRIFDAGPATQPVPLAGLRVGITICEDLWIEPDERAEVPRYGAIDPAGELAASGADLIVNLSASPFARGRPEQREALVRNTARRIGRPVALVNQVVALEELLFDGGSLAADATGALLARAPLGASALLEVVLGAAGTIAAWPDTEAAVRALLVMGIREYVERQGFAGVLVGLSGGIDSALVADLAAEALGGDRVLGVALPSEFSSEGSLRDARDLAKNLGLALHEVPIETAWHALRAGVDRVTGPRPFGLTDENLQARARGAILMGLANATQRLLLTTGNKSEIAVGYCTLYGDMCGGLAPIGDLWKTEVFALARASVARGRIPSSSLTKPPSAELRPDQRDEDSLPPYARLDRILEDLVVLERAVADIEARQSDAPAGEVRRIARLVQRNEWKRKQGAPILRVSRKAFGTGRRLPLVQGDPEAPERAMGTP